MLIVERRETRNRIDHEQCRMPRIVDGLADGGNRRDRPGRCLVVNNADGLDFVISVFSQICLDLVRVSSAAPVAFNELRFQIQFFGDFFPQSRKMPGFEHQHPVARRQNIDQCSLPTAGARRWIDHDILLGLEDGFDPFQGLRTDFAEGRSPVVNHLTGDRAQYPVRDRTGAWNLQKMTTSLSHKSNLVGPAFERAAQNDIEVVNMQFLIHNSFSDDADQGTRR